MIGEHAVVDPLPAIRPAVGDLHRLVVVRHELAGAKVGAHAAQVIPLWLEAVLHDVLGIEACLRRVLTVGIDGQHHGDLAQRVVVPVDHRPVRHLVLVAVLLRRVVQPGLVEHALLEVELGGIDRERDADLTLSGHLVEIHGSLAVDAQVGMVLGDQVGQVQPLAAEGFRAANTQRANDVRRRRRGDADGERRAGAIVRNVVEDELDVRL